MRRGWRPAPVSTWRRTSRLSTECGPGRRASCRPPRVPDGSAGMTRSQVARTVIVEGLFVALLGGLIGLAGGLVGGWLPLRLFTFAITGYLYPLVIPWSSGALALAAALGIGFVASLLPARR